jgi:hypothetical protein
VLRALLDFDVHARFIAAGFSSARAASLVGGMIIVWLKDSPQTAARTVQKRRK